MNKNKFVDRFSKHSSVYAYARPDYPSEIYRFLSEIVPSRDAVWDCATGNGQAAVVLADYFDQIYATDASEQQIRNARAHEKVKYTVATAEASGLESESVDLITVATAAHWFNLDAFYGEVKRVLKPGGVLAMWAYCRFTTENEPVNALMQKMGREVLKEYWDPNLDRIWDGYETWPFPFEDIDHDKWPIVTNWSRDEMLAYISTWSATNNYIEKHGETPLVAIECDLAKVWPDGDEKVVFSTVLTSRIGRV